MRTDANQARVSAEEVAVGPADVGPKPFPRQKFKMRETSVAELGLEAAERTETA